MRLTTKFGVLLVVTMAILSGVVYAGFQTQRDRIVDQERRQTQETADAIADRIDYQIAEQKRNVELAANDPAMRQFGSSRQQRALSRLMNDTEFDTVAVLNRSGVKYAFRGVPERVRKKLVGRNYSDRPYVKRALAGEVYVTDPFDADTGSRIAVISAPLRDRNGTVVGVVGGSVVLNDEEFFSSVRQYDTESQAIVVSGPDQALYDRNESFEDPVTATATVESTGWTVEVRRSRAPISQRMRTSMGSLVVRQAGVVVVVLLVLTAFGTWVYRTNLRQTAQLLDGFDELGDGNYGHDPRLGGSEEWRRIESGFTDLADTLAERERQLREERDRFATLFENVPDPAVIYRFEDDRPVVDRANAPFAEVFGADDGTPLADCLRSAEDAAEFDPDTLVGTVADRTLRLQTDGGPRDFVVQNAPLGAADGPGGGCLVCTDITEQRRRERELARQNERLDQFASVVSHDLRNPIEILQGYLGRLEADVENDDYVEHMREATARMEAMVEDLLTLAQEGQTVGDTTPLALEDVVAEAWNAVDTGDATLENGVEDAALEADRRRLSAVFENLFRNAREHAAPEDAENGDLTVRVGTTEDGFFVADDGPGIDPEERSAVFEFGHTNADGTGLGLAIVESVVEAHGWTVEVTDAEDGGARFDVRGVEFLSATHP